METIFNASLILHITAGFSALITGTTAILSKKGQRVHRFAGKIFFWSMIGAGITGFIMSLIKNNQFLLAISVFALYLDYVGFRSVHQKRMNVIPFDWMMGIAAILTSAYMISTLNIILVVFGSILGINALNEIRLYWNPEKFTKDKLFWLYRHIGMMSGCYIASVTAFLVVNIRFVKPDFIVWLAPTVIGAPLIAYATAKYKKKKQRLALDLTE